MSGLTSALSGLSSSCQQALPSLLTSSFASCANVLQLVNVATGSGSVVEPLTTYIEGICTNEPCSQSDLSNASSIIQNGCSSDIQDGSIIPYSLSLVVNQYPEIRSLLCTQQQSNGTYCVPEVLSAAENSTGTSFTLSALTGLVGGQNTSAFIDSIPASTYCTDCGHAITTEATAIVQSVSPNSVDTVKSSVTSKCGASFADGQLPSGITTAGANGTSTASSSKGAASRSVQFNPKNILAAGTAFSIVAGLMVLA